MGVAAAGEGHSSLVKAANPHSQEGRWSWSSSQALQLQSSPQSQQACGASTVARCRRQRGGRPHPARALAAGRVGSMAAIRSDRDPRSAPSAVSCHLRLLARRQSQGHLQGSERARGALHAASHRRRGSMRCQASPMIRSFRERRRRTRRAGRDWRCDWRCGSVVACATKAPTGRGFHCRGCCWQHRVVCSVCLSRATAATNRPIPAYPLAAFATAAADVALRTMANLGPCALRRCFSKTPRSRFFGFASSFSRCEVGAVATLVFFIGCSLRRGRSCGGDLEAANLALKRSEAGGVACKSAIEPYGWRCSITTNGLTRA